MCCEAEVPERDRERDLVRESKLLPWEGAYERQPGGERAAGLGGQAAAVERVLA